MIAWKEKDAFKNFIQQAFVTYNNFQIVITTL